MDSEDDLSLELTQNNEQRGQNESLGHTCLICSKAFCSSSSLNRHLKKIHKEKPICSRRPLLNCPLCLDECEITYANCRVMHQHLKEIHGDIFKCEHLAFRSWEDFLKWKKDLEMHTTSRYVKHSGNRIYSNSGLRIYYFCNRSGYFRGHGSGYRLMKSQGSCKINGYCPSQMIVTKSPGSTVKVEFMPVHIGHEMDKNHLPLQKDEREWIATLLRTGADAATILEKARRDSPNATLSKVSRKDLHNIKTAFRISNTMLGPRLKGNPEMRAPLGTNGDSSKPEAIDEPLTQSTPSIYKATEVHPPKFRLFKFKSGSVAEATSLSGIALPTKPEVVATTLSSNDIVEESAKRELLELTERILNAVQAKIRNSESEQELEAIRETCAKFAQDVGVSFGENVLTAPLSNGNDLITIISAHDSNGSSQHYQFVEEQVEIAQGSEISDPS